MTTLVSSIQPLTAKAAILSEKREELLLVAEIPVALAALAVLFFLS